MDSRVWSVTNYKLLITLLIFLDQITKAIFASRDFFLGFIHFKLVKNFGLPFGINFTPAISLILVLLIFLFLLLFWFKNQNNLSRSQQLALSLVLSGAVSNIADRIVFGFVRDFLDVNLGFVFNLADVFVVLGVIIMLFSGSAVKVLPKSG